MKPTDKPPKKQPKNRKIQHINWRWIFTITVLSFFISISFSYISDAALDNVGNVIAFIILFLFIVIGVLFDIIGIAATSTTEKEFHSMASKKVPGAKEAVWIARNASKVSSFCNDVVGDIAGIISGATAAVIIARVTASMQTSSALIASLVITGCVAALTIGGKACGKGIGIGHSVTIVFMVGRFMAVMPVKLEKKR